MKRTLPLLITLIIAMHSAAQCNQNLSFSTQTAIDNFFTLNSTCTSLTTVVISLGAENDPILNLDAMQSVESIQYLGIANIDPGCYEGNCVEYDLTGLVSLTSINQIYIEGPGIVLPLPSLTSLQELTTMNASDFDFCNTITTTPTIQIRYNTAAYSIFPGVDFGGLGNMQQTSQLLIEANAPTLQMTNIFPSLLEAQNIQIQGYSDEAMIHTIDGFHALQVVDGIYVYSSMPTLSIQNMSICNNLSSLSTLEFTADITNSFNSFASLTNIQSFTVSNENSYQTSGNMSYTFPLLAYAEYLTISAWSTQNLTFNFPSLTETGSVNIQHATSASTTINWTQLESAANISLVCTPFSPPSGLGAFNINAPNIQQIGDLFIWYTNFTNLLFLSSLESITNVDISENPYLNYCSISAICDQLNTAPALVNIQNNLGNCMDNDAVLSQCTSAEPVITGQVYIDLNCNGQFDTNDIPFNNPLLILNSTTPIASSSTNGTYIIHDIPSGIIHIEPQVDQTFIAPQPLIIDTDTLSQTEYIIDFPLCANPNFYDSQLAHLQISPLRPGFSSLFQLHAANNSYNSESVTITVEHDLFASLTNWTCSQDFNITGNQLVVGPIYLEAFSSLVIELEALLSVDVAIGQNYTCTSTIASENADANPTNNMASFNGTVIGSYDPNDMQVNWPLIDAVEADPLGDWLTYQIRFQNTGTAPAEFINVVSTQDDNVDMSTIQMIAASHANTWSFDGREVTWFFDNIQLPDSTTDLEGSQGYILFKVRTIPGLQAGDSLTTNAAIYFDYNQPIITNQATTTYYVCPADLLLATDEPVVCQYDWASAYANDGYESYTWSVDNQVLSTMQNFNYSEFPSGTQTITCTANATPAICQSTASIEIDIIAVPDMPAITQVGNTLTATGNGTFVWGYDGGIFTNTTNTLEITESGIYSVYIDGVCPSATATGSFTYTSITENNPFTFIVYPNPSHQWIMIEAPTLRGSIAVTDLLGRVVYQNQLNAKSPIDISNWDNGSYVVAITTADGIVKRPFIKQ